MKTLKLKLLLVLTLLVATVGMVPPVALAADKPPVSHCADTETELGPYDDPDQFTCCPASVTTPDTNDCLVKKYVTPAVEMLSVVVGLAVTASIIFGAIQYSSSEGDPGKAQAAQKRIRNTLIALIVFVFLVALLNFLTPEGL